MAIEEIFERWKALSKIRNNLILSWVFWVVIIVVKVNSCYMIFSPTLVFVSRNVFIIMLTLVVLSLIASYIVEWIYNRVSVIVFER